MVDGYIGEEMAHILTMIVDQPPGGKIAVRYDVSEGLLPAVALAAVQAVAAELQRAVIEAEVERRLNVKTFERENVGTLEEKEGEK